MNINQKLQVPEGIIQTELDDEVVLMHVESGKYYSLNAVGAVVWKYLSSPRTLSELCEVVVDEFEVDPETCRRDVEGLVEDLIGLNLVEVLD